MHSHFLLLVLFAFFVSFVFALIARDEPREQLRFGGMLFAAFHRIRRRPRLADVSVPVLTHAPPPTARRTTDHA